MKFFFEHYRINNSSASIFILFILWLLAFYPTTAGLISRWSDLNEGYGHGFVILLLVAYLIIKPNNNLANFSFNPSLVASSFLAVFSTIWFLVAVVHIDILQQLLMPLILLLAIWSVWGMRVTAAYLFPIAFLYFSIPIWDYINRYLVDITVVVVRTFLNLVGIVAFVEGNSVQIVSGEIVIADGCSGLRYLVVGSALSVFGCYVNFKRAKTWGWTIFFGVFVSLFANWVRVFLLIVIGYVTEMQSGLMRNHDNFGWMVFFVFMSPIFFLFWGYSEKDTDKGEKNEAISNLKANKAKLWKIWIPLSSLLIGPVLFFSIYAKEMHGYSLQFVAPKNLAFKSLYENSIWSPELPDPDKKLEGTFYLNDSKVAVLSYIYIKNRKGEKLLPFISAIYNGDKWIVLDKFSYRANSMNTSVELVTLKRVSGVEKLVVAYWYDVGGFNTISYTLAKISQIPAEIKGKNFSMLTIVSGACEESCDSAIGNIKHILESVDLRSQTILKRTNNSSGYSR